MSRFDKTLPNVRFVTAILRAAYRRETNKLSVTLLIIPISRPGIAPRRSTAISTLTERMLAQARVAKGKRI
jgi:hypothetical protein